MNDRRPKMKGSSLETGLGGPISGASTTSIGDGLSCSRKRPKRAKAGGDYVLEYRLWPACQSVSQSVLTIPLPKADASRL